jgi:hypothetical protein
VVLFEDLKYNIFEVHSDQLRMQLIFAFLKLLGADLEGVALLREDAARSSAAGDASTTTSALVAVSSNHVSRKRDFIERDDLGDVFAVLDSLSITAPAVWDVDPYASPSAAVDQPRTGVEISERMDTLSTSWPAHTAASKHKTNMWLRNVTTITDTSKLKFIRYRIVL